MPLKSFQFAGNQRFEQCLVIDSAHVVPGEVGPHVRDIQFAIGLQRLSTCWDGRCVVTDYVGGRIELRIRSLIVAPSRSKPHGSRDPRGNGAGSATSATKGEKARL